MRNTHCGYQPSPAKESLTPPTGRSGLLPSAGDTEIAQLKQEIQKLKQRLAYIEGAVRFSTWRA